MKIYADAGVFIQAWRHLNPAKREQALRVLSTNEVAVSAWLHLELMPKPTAYKQAAELEFLRLWLPAKPSVGDEARSDIELAWRMAGQHGLGALDALHAAAALRLGCEQFVTTEDPDKPIFRLREIRVVHLADALV